MVKRDAAPTPALMVKVWLYAYALQVTSSRRLEQRIREDLAFRYLAGGSTPDYWTLNDFRTRRAQALNDLFVQVVEVARGLGMAKLGHVAIDSTRVRANASRHRTETAEELRQRLAKTPPSSCGVPTQGPAGDNATVRSYLYLEGANGNAFSATRQLTPFDSLNRLTNATGNSYPSGTTAYNLPYSIGEYGNATCVQNQQTQGPCAPLTFNTSNQITGYTYDPAGDITADATNQYQYTWDAEGHLTKLVYQGNTIFQATYNALGERAEFTASNYQAEQGFDPAGGFLGQYNSTGSAWWQEDIQFGGRTLATIWVGCTRCFCTRTCSVRAIWRPHPRARGCRTSCSIPGVIRGRRWGQSRNKGSQVSTWWTLPRGFTPPQLACATPGWAAG